MTIQADKSIEEAQIHRLIEDLLKAVRDGDLDRLMKCYDPKIVSFDMIPPLQYVGIEAYRRNWQLGLECMSGSLEFEMQDLSITVADEAAFCHALNHIKGTDSQGRGFNNWVRWTACLRKLNGQWLISHEHISVPIDVQSGRALMDLKP